MLNENIEAFIVYVAFFTSKMIIYLAQKTQIALLLAEKVTIPEEYSDFANIFSKKLVGVLSECMGINKKVMELQKSKQPPYGLIYSLGQVKLKILKTYIKINWDNNFIRPSKFPAETPIIIVQKPNNSLHLCVDYQWLNNLTI